MCVCLPCAELYGATLMLLKMCVCLPCAELYGATLRLLEILAHRDDELRSAVSQLLRAQKPPRHTAAASTAYGNGPAVEQANQVCGP